MVNKKNLLRWVLIAIIGVLLGYQVLSHLAINTNDGSPDSGENVSILVAGRYVPAFATISLRSVSIQDYPRGFVPPGALFSAKELVDTKGQPLFLSAVPIPEGQPITRTLLLDVAKSRGLASLLTPGKVAVSFSADQEHTVGSWIQPGDTIAIYQTPNTGMPSRGNPGTRLLFPAVTVLAVDKTRLGSPDKLEDATKDPTAALLAENAQEGNSVLTVLLNIAQAPVFIEAKEQGRLTVVLRAVGDDINEDSHGK